jgi:hypothetical protein
MSWRDVKLRAMHTSPVTLNVADARQRAAGEASIV